MDYLTTVRVLDTDYKLKDEEAARIHHTHKVAEIEDMPDSKALLPTGGGAGQVLAKKSGTDYDVEWQDSSSTVPSVIPVDKGGTGADTAIGARENLFAAELMSGDFNSYNATGVYQSHGSMSNQPTGNCGVLFVLRSVIGNVVRISQVYYADKGNNVFSRTGTGTSLDSITWTGWARLVRSDELDAYARRNGSGLTNAWLGIWNGRTSDPGYRLETCWFVNGAQRGLCVDTYNRLRFYGSGVNNWSLGNLSGDKSMTAIHSMYNPNNGQHVYTGNTSEISDLVNAGWRDEGAKFYAFV